MNGNQFDLFQGQVERDRGIEQVTQGSGRWFDHAMQVVRRLPRGWRGLAEDLRPLIEAELGPPPRSTNVYGAITREAIKLGLLRPTGLRRPMRLSRSHARPSDEYVKVTWRAA